MKADNNVLLQQQLETVKGDLVQALIQFSNFMQQTALIDVANNCSIDKEEKAQHKHVDPVSFVAFKRQVEYVQRFLSMAKMFPFKIQRELGWITLRNCDNLLKSVFHEVAKASSHGADMENGSAKDYRAYQQTLVTLLILPMGQLVHDCIEMNTSVLLDDDDENHHTVDILVKHSISMVGESTRFLISQTGIYLKKPEFLRILGFSQKLWKFAHHALSLSNRNKTEKIIAAEMNTIAVILNKDMPSLLCSENGKILIKFWCENLNIIGKESILCEGLHHIAACSTDYPEVYTIFTSYLQNTSFWKTDTGQRLTPVVIQGILMDMSSDKSETRKRASFVLKLLVDQYSQNIPIFHSEIYETRMISLNNMECGEYTRVWESFFDLYDILNETQLHIVQPVLHKLQIFKEHSSNDSVLVWLPIILKKMIGHDNRTVVKEGFQQFLETGKYVDNMEENSGFGKFAKEFLEKYILPLIRDHVGWILNDPAEFFENIGRFGRFLLRLNSNDPYPEFKSADIILNFLTSSGKCMGPHTILFLVASFDEILSDRNTCDGDSGTGNREALSANLDMLMNQLALLVSNNLTTVSKYFRELLEQRCVSILHKSMSYLEQLPKILPASPTFMKFLAFFGSVSVKTFYSEKIHSKVQCIVKMFIKKEPHLLNEFIVGSNLYDFIQLNLSSNSAIGVLRFITVSSLICNASLSEKVNMSIENFAMSNSSVEILPGSIDGLWEIYHCILNENAAVANTYVSMWNEVCDTLRLANELCAENFMSCVRKLEVLSSLPSRHLIGLPLPHLRMTNSGLKSFLFQKLSILRGSLEFPGDSRQDMETAGFESLAILETISETYSSVTGRNLFAEYHLAKFKMYSSILESTSRELHDLQYFKYLLTVIVDEIEKCDAKGAAAGLMLAKSVATLVNSVQNWDAAYLLDEIASIGWSLVFENRKNESFWIGIKAFVGLITCHHYVRNGILSKYADLLFEQGETVSGLSIVLVQQLVTTEYPLELTGQVHEILIKAALSGGPLPKNNRVSFAIWEHIRNANEDDDPENFSSDSKSRLLACEKIRHDIATLLSTEESKAVGLNLLHSCVLSLLERSDNESIKRRRYFQGSSTHRIKHRICQLLLVLQPYFDFDISKTVMKRVLTSLSTDSPQPSVRYMGEWLLILTIQQNPELNTLLFECLDECIQTRLGFGAFFSTICLHVSKFLNCPQFYDKTLQSLSTLTLSQHLTVRIYAQIAFQKIYDRAREMNYRDLLEKYGPIITSLSQASFYVSGNCSKLLENVSQDFYVNVFDSSTHYCAEVIFVLLPRLSGMSRDECILHPGIIRKTMQLTGSSGNINKQCKFFENPEVLQNLYLDHEKSAWHLKTVVADGRELGEEMPSETLSKQFHNVEVNYQKKINPWKLLSISEEIDEYSSASSKKKCVGDEGLIVVASLLDHLPNLGGLCRTCEIFGVNKYVINSLKVVNDQHFQSLSVSAQNWVNILEVPVRDLESFLLTYSAKGYTILGVEQANESSSLTDYVFPKKSVLLLGNEKLGIPPGLLHLVDKCIEIPQVGIIRSLNVHVTGALCIWQYASQNIL